MARKVVLCLIFLLLFSFINFISAYKTYDISEAEFEAGYTQDLSPGDKINFPFNGGTYYFKMGSIYKKSVNVGASENSGQFLIIDDEHPQLEVNFELNYDWNYDLNVKLNSIDWVTAFIANESQNSASITIKKTNEEIPKDTNLPYICQKYYTCDDGSKVEYCSLEGQGCKCKNPYYLCPKPEPEPCEKFYTCPDGSEVQYCEVITSQNGGGCGCKTNPESLCESTSTETYFKSCSYIWDSSTHIGETVKISASIVDEKGNKDSDSAEVNVVENSLVGGGGGAYPMDGKVLDIQITEPSSGSNVFGAFEIKISSKGPNKLEEMSLGISGEDWGIGFPISNRNCVAGNSGGGGSEGENKCEKFHICPDSVEIQYCFIHKMYDDKGELVGAGCGCKANPEALCESPNSGGGGSKPTEIPSTGGGRGSNETPIICNGCILGDKCVQIGYRANEKYCDITSEFLEQKEASLQCDNNFECSTNLCIDDACVSGNVWQKFLRFFGRLFGRD